MKLKIVKIVDFSFGNLNSNRIAILNRGTPSHYYVDRKEKVM